MELNRRLLAGAAVIVALTLLYLLSPPSKTVEGGEQRESLKETLLSSQKIGSTILETYFVGGNYAAAVKTGPAPSDLFTVLPGDRVFEGSSSEPPATPRPVTENAFSDPVPANSSFNRTVSLGKGAEPALFLVGENPEGGEWERVLRKVSALKLNAAEAIALQEKLNEALAAVYGNYSVLEEIVDFAKNASETRILNPDYDAEKAIKEKKVETKTKPINYYELLNETVSGIPEKLEFKVSEKDLVKTKRFSLEAPAELGEPLISAVITGTGKKYFSIEEDVGEKDAFYGVRQIEFKIKADVSSALNGEGVITFDEKDASLRVRIGSPFLVALEERETQLKIIVEHVVISDDSPPPSSFDSSPEDFAEEFTQFICPTPGRRIARYGYSDEYFNGKIWHAGIDIGHTSAVHDPIYASATGIVQSVYSSGNCGNGALLNHYRNGVRIQTLYCHLSKVLVEPGQSVAQGQQIGVKGTTGKSTGVHLHFEIRVNGKNVNPEEYVSFKEEGSSLVCDPQSVPSRAKKIFVDPGHGCSSGAEHGGVEEAELNAKVARHLVAILEANGYETRALYSTCEKEYKIPDRYEAANEWGADLFVSIHHDAAKTGRQAVFYNREGEKGAKSKALAESVRLALLELEVAAQADKALPDSDSQHDYLGVLKNTRMPAILVEVTRVDDPALWDESFALNAAKAIVNGIKSYS